MLSNARYILISLFVHGVLIGAISYRPSSSKITIGHREGRVSFLQFAVPSRQAGVSQPKPQKKKLKPKKKSLNNNSDFLKKNYNKEVQYRTSGSTVSVVGKSSEAQSSDIFGNYVFKVIKQIEKEKFYPRLAKRKKHEGVVIAEFIIAKNGRLKEIISIESKHGTLKKAVRELINRQDSFPKIPTGLKKDTVRLRVPIRFELEESI
ncbi:MAG: energy transducer TonB [Bdellovibrionales bacterium]|nr:energy transducer TonB [Bdellovibrionales bacterium]NQZ19030.1 energy transducer TonB [Bdellovibrionales bacterium]